MITNILQNKEYSKLSASQVKEQLMMLVGLVDGFSITANINKISFNPEIPQSIKDNFSQYTLFALANYTFESVVLSEDHMSFEAGFGEENIGSVVTIPYECIFQIIVDDSIVFINPSATMVQKENKQEVDQEERSKNAFRMNPKNKKLID